MLDNNSLNMPLLIILHIPGTVLHVLSKDGPIIIGLIKVLTKMSEKHLYMFTRVEIW